MISCSSASALRLTRMRHANTNDLNGIIVSARLRAQLFVGANTLIAPITAGAHGRIVSISRGSPPLKQR